MSDNHHFVALLWRLARTVEGEVHDALIRAAETIEQQDQALVNMKGRTNLAYHRGASDLIKSMRSEE